MSLTYDSHGNLFEGLYELSFEEIRAEFGCSTPRREWLMHQLETLVQIAKASGKLERLIIWGSFVSKKPIPQDIDLLLVFTADFSDEDITGDLLAILDHEQAKIKFQADIFWIRKNLSPEVFEIFLDTYKTDRQKRRRGIVELIL